MPRICDSSDEPLDFCKRCMPSEADAEEEYGDVEKTGEGPDGRGNCFAYEPFHPPYGDYAGDFHCESCGKELTERDD